MKVSALRRSTFDDGVWREIPEFGVSVLVRASNHLAYRGAVQAGLQPHQRRLRTGGMLPPGVNDRIVSRSVAKHLLLGWKGVEDDEGNELPYTLEKATELAEDPDYTEFFKAVERAGDDLATMQAEERADLGNS